MITRSSMVTLPGQGWVSDFNPVIVERLVDAKFSLIPSPTSTRFGGGVGPEVGVCVSSELSPTLRDAERVFAQVRAHAHAARLLALIVVGPSDMPLAALNYDGSYDGGLLDDDLTKCFPDEHIVWDYLSVSWSVGVAQKETFRLQRSIWASAVPTNLPIRLPDTLLPELPIEKLLSMRLGSRCVAQEPSTPTFAQRKFPNEVGLVAWRNARVTTIGSRVVLKELILQQRFPVLEQVHGRG